MIFSSSRYMIILLAIFSNVMMAENKSQKIVIKDAWVRPSQLENSAAYMTIENKGSGLDHLLSAETTACEYIELHRIEEVNGVFFMKNMQDGIDIPAGSLTILKPSGMHIMLMKLRRAMKIGEKIDLKLVFQNAGTINLQVDIKSKNNPEPILKDHETEELNLNPPVPVNENASGIKKS